MTTVDIVFRCPAPPTEQVAVALGRVRDVYGIRQLRFDRAAHTLCVEFDATRLNAAAVANLVRATGLEIEAELPQAAAREPAATTPAS